METNTQGKIDEAKFFLSKFYENYNNNDFQYYLSAFVSASRSILWIMKAEFGKNSLFENWYSKRQATEDESSIFELFNELRITTIKIKPIETHRTISSIGTAPEGINLAEFLGKEMTVNISEPDKDGNVFLSVPTESGETLISKMEEYKIVNKLSDEEDLYNLCEKYLNVLVTIYHEWLTINNPNNE